MSEKNRRGRSVEELTEPDSRSASFVRVDLEAGQIRSVTIQDADETLMGIEESLTPRIPEKVRERVKVVRSLIVYAWFCYDFYAVSMFWSFSCIEMALWTKYDELKPGFPDVEKHRSFKALITWADGAGLLPKDISADAVRKLRNSMAHPKHFNMVVFPGAAFDSFALLVKILSALWPG